MAEVNETNNARPDDSVGPGNGKKRNPVFFIILGILIIGGGWFGISKYSHALHHEETDDAQVSADIIPVIPRVAGYVDQVFV